MSSAPTTLRRITPALVLEAWHGITAREFRITTLCGLGLFLFHIGNGLGLGPGGWGISLILIADELKAFGILLGFVVADRITNRDPERRGVYVVALSAGAAIGAFLAVAFVTTALTTLTQRRFHLGTGFFVYVYFDLVLIGSGALWLINDRRRAALARARMHRAELDRIEAEKRSIESDLQALQARVEPGFLFNTLAQVKALYQQEPASAQHMLDELIAYLRAAMPRMRDTSSTLRQELDLARAYLAIVQVRLREAFRFEVEAPDASVDARVPPMMLLPLLDHAMTHGNPRAQAMLRIRAGVQGTTTRIEIVDTAHAFDPSRDTDALRALPERLAALFGREGMLLLESTADTSRALLTIPYHAAASEHVTEVALPYLPARAA